MLKILSFLAILISCSSHQITRNPSSAPHQKTWGKYLHDEFFAHQGLKHFFAEAEYLIMPWQRNRDIVFHKPLAPYQVQVKPLSCKSKKLYPTHPQQSTKDYLHAAWAGYQHHKVPINSSVCIQPNPSRRYCLNSTFANVVVLSDTFQDSCQNLYRGYWVVTYLKKDESLGTLASKGRTFYPKPGSVFKEFEVDGTYAVPEKQFLFLGELLPGDAKKIKAQQAEALKLGLKFKNYLYSR